MLDNIRRDQLTLAENVTEIAHHTREPPNDKPCHAIWHTERARIYDTVD